MKKNSLISLIILLFSALFLSGCLYDITSIVVPPSTNTGKVITFTVTGSVSSLLGSTNGGGIVLQIPEGTRVLRVHYNVSGGQGFLTENSDITLGYQPEVGYHLYGGVAESDGNAGSIILRVWLAVPAGVSPGTYKIKAAVGDYSGGWTPQSPQIGGAPVMDFSQVTGKYASSDLVITAGAPDTTAPSDVTPNIIETYSFDMSSYDEASQGDVAAYRVYVSEASFATTAGRQLLDETTMPSVSGNNSNDIFFSEDIGSGLFYLEIPPGSEYPLVLYGLFSNNYYFAVTAVDISGNESSPVVVPRLTGAVTGRVTNGASGIQNVWVNVHDTNCSNYMGYASTNAIGDYAVVGLPTGDYKISFSHYGSGYLNQWFNGKSDCSTSDTISVIAPAETKVNSVLAQGGRIKGKVTNGASGIQNVWVNVYDTNCNYLQGDSADANGNYSVIGLPTGGYKVYFQYWGSDNYLSEWNNANPDCSTADIVSVTAPDTVTLNAVLAQGGRITGTVTDGTSGFQDVHVSIYNTNCNYVQGTSTDTNGNYSVIGLKTGDYKVNFQEYTGNLNEWYDGKSDCGTADTISVTAPQQVTVNATLPRFRELSVRKEGAGTGVITSNPSGINCGNTCYKVFDAESAIYLTASAAPGSVFANWLGACLGNVSPCKVTMSSDKAVTATFDSIADFTAVPTYGAAPLFVSFIDNSQDPSSWSWTFGDGDTSTFQDPVHNYALPGTYTVSLNISTDNGSYSMTKNSYIYVTSCANKPARSGINSYFDYPSIQSAYESVGDGEFVEAQAKVYTENLNFMNNTSVTFRGGFDCNYSTNQYQYTTVHGTVTISDGSVTFENLAIR